MIPLRDHNKTSTFPFITYLFIGVNTFVFYLMYLSGADPESFIYTYALIPGEIVQGIDLITLFTSMFMHGGFGHILSNMLFLHIFGDNLEDRLGHLKYLIYYLLCGLGASFLQIAVNPTSEVPNLGASGAIAGLMGGYILLFPKHRIDILLPVGGFLRTTTVPAFTMLFYWIATQFLLGFGSLSDMEGGGVAFFAHIGGFLSGLILVNFLKRRNYRELPV